jgi:hypothetical protein
LKLIVSKYDQWAGSAGHEGIAGAASDRRACVDKRPSPPRVVASSIFGRSGRRFSVRKCGHS